MNQDIPQSHQTQDDTTPCAGRDSSSLATRIGGLCAAAPAIAVIVIAIWLTPDRRGYGTHEQLSLPQCSFLYNTGWPCPTCGLTTSMSDMAHGRIGDAAIHHPFGMLLFPITAVTAILGLIELASGKPVWVKLRLKLWHLIALTAILLICWGIKAWIGAASGQFPLR